MQSLLVFRLGKGSVLRAFLLQMVTTMPQISQQVCLGLSYPADTKDAMFS